MTRLTALALLLALPSALWADALTDSLASEKGGMVAETREASRSPVAATIDGVVMKSCVGGVDKVPCDPFFYIVLPQQLDAMMTGGKPMSLARCKELGIPMGCAKGIQLEMKEKTVETLAPLVRKRVSVYGIIRENNAEGRELPAIMRVETLKTAKP